ncbi:hypothetical protein ABEF95_008917 [Exophiala dermatitidis]|uniref:Uncharacterized protein n=1 Tax=Exophiala dermatitidis (strain ATCC 34100 / CBS 525.76 / NIH/UT8656) TaxID=858893 RepID=H6C0X5_EXODN|nr:uncharacterized protein HMPREF1120_05355 [Exophiala dermatitidis NIH/UT8656]EHY57313.1 hypothetical protein HMPREF1120_05355 [Exophiala dermatitidis NIH/UT8656]
MAPTALTPLVDVSSVGRRPLTEWKQVSVCEHVGCILTGLLVKALSWLAKGVIKLLSWLWHASGAAYLFDIILRALTIVAIGYITFWIVFIAIKIVPIAIRIVLRVVRERRERTTPRGVSGDSRHFHGVSAASSSSEGFANFRTSPHSNYGTCSESASRGPPPQDTNTYQQFIPPTEPSPVTPPTEPSPVTPAPPTEPSSVTFQKWHDHTKTCLEDKSSLQEFPYPPIASCTECRAKQNQGQPCDHAIADFFRQSPEYSCQWLKQERNRWHPDKFVRCSASIRKSAEDIFKVVQGLHEGHPPP